jgi:hypothetical protein
MGYTPSPNGQSAGLGKYNTQLTHRIEVALQSMESERSCICVLVTFRLVLKRLRECIDVDIFYDFSIRFLELFRQCGGFFWVFFPFIKTII